MAEPFSDPLLRGFTAASLLATQSAQRDAARQANEVERYKAYLAQQKLLAEQQAQQYRQQVNMELAKVFETPEFYYDPKTVIPRVMSLTSAIGDPKLGAGVAENLFKLSTARNLQLVGSIADSYAASDLAGLARAYADYHAMQTRRPWQAIAVPGKTGVTIKLVSTEPGQDGKSAKQSVLLDDNAIQSMMLAAITNAGQDPSQYASGLSTYRKTPSEIAVNYATADERHANALAARALAGLRVAEAGKVHADTDQTRVETEKKKVEAKLEQLNFDARKTNYIMGLSDVITESILPKTDIPDPEQAQLRPRVSNIASAFATLHALRPDDPVLADPATLTRQFLADELSNDNERRNAWRIEEFRKPTPDGKSILAGGRFIIPGRDFSKAIDIDPVLVELLRSLLNIRRVARPVEPRPANEPPAVEDSIPFGAP